MATPSTLIAEIGVKAPPAENRSMAVRSVHSEYQLYAPPGCSTPSWMNGVLVTWKMRPASAAPAMTTSPRAPTRIAESPATNTMPPDGAPSVGRKGSTPRASDVSATP
ncbi:hypothetical protein LMG3412_06281 [Achromobacter deleyi]|nr:hypothetical protein LMG3412_06281 [Achromobacter deleyi]